MKLGPWDGRCTGCGRTRPEVNFAPRRRKCYGCCHRAYGRSDRGVAPQKPTPPAPQLSPIAPADRSDISAANDPVDEIPLDVAEPPTAEPVGRSPLVPSRFESPPFERTVALFDIHWPSHDVLFMRAVESFLRSNWVHRVALVGDFGDMESASRHGGNPNRPKVVDDLAAVKVGIVRVREAAREGWLRSGYQPQEPEIVAFEGNHETRLARLIADLAPMLHGLISFEDEIASVVDRWVPEDEQPIQYGTTRLLHGHQIAGGGQYKARVLAEEWADPGITAVCGHFHASQQVQKKHERGPRVGMVMGCGRDLQPEWHKGVTGWNHEFLVIDVMADGKSVNHRVRVHNGRFSFGERAYSGAVA